MSRTALTLAALLGAAAPALAQRTAAGASAAKCAAGDARADWSRAQLAWMRDSVPHPDSLRAALGAAASALGPGAAQFPPQLGAHVADSASLGQPSLAGSAESAAMAARLVAMARDRQAPWPTKSVVGPSGVRLMFRLAQSDTSLARVALHRMMEAGPDESFPADVATLEDEVRLRRGRKQLYATQLRVTAGGAVEPFPTEDLAHVDMRREAAGLPPLARAICEARAARR